MYSNSKIINFLILFVAGIVLTLPSIVFAFDFHGIEIGMTMNQVRQLSPVPLEGPKHNFRTWNGHSLSMLHSDTWDAQRADVLFLFDTQKDSLVYVGYNFQFNKDKIREACAQTNTPESECSNPDGQLSSEVSKYLFDLFIARAIEKHGAPERLCNASMNGFGMAEYNIASWGTGYTDCPAELFLEEKKKLPNRPVLIIGQNVFESNSICWFRLIDGSIWQ